MNGKFQDSKGIWTAPKETNRADHIDYSEHLLRKTVQRNPLRSSHKELPISIKNDFLEHRKNLPLYLHRLTADLKHKNGNGKNIRELFTSKNPDEPIVVLPNLAKNRPPARFEVEKEFKLPNDPLTRRIFEDLTHQEPMDFFVIETPAAEEKKKNEKINAKPVQRTEEKIQMIIRGKLENELYHKLDKCYREYTKIRITQKLRQLTLEETQLAKGQQRKNQDTPKESVLSFKNPRVVQFFTTQTLDANPSPEPGLEVTGTLTGDVNSKAKEEEEEDIKLIEDICKKEKLKLCEFFNMEENLFNRKYQNEFLEDYLKGRGLVSPTLSLSNSPTPKIRMFDTLDLDDHQRHTKLYGKKLFVNDEIAKRRERDFLFDQYTLTLGVRLNKGLNPAKNSKRRRNIIMQTKYRQDPLAEDPQEKIKIEKVTIATGEDAKLIKNTEKFMEMFPKSGKNLASPSGPAGWWVEAIMKTDVVEEQSTEKITFEDDEKQVINKIFRSGNFHSRAQSDRLGTTGSTFGNFTSPRSTITDKRQAAKISSVLNFAKVRQNKQQTKELKSIFNDFYEDLVELTAVGEEETFGIELKIIDTATEFGLEYDKIKLVHDQEVIKNLAKDFTNLQKKNKFKHRLIFLLSSKIIDKKGLLEEYDKLRKEEKLNQRLAKNFR